MTPESPKISVALCTYNGERFLEEQLESIAAQTIAPGELIVGDDGSTDNTLAILRSFRDRVKFPVVVNVNESSLGSTRNFESVVRRCSGDVTLLADQDDIWHPEKVAICVQKFAEDPQIGFVFTDAELIDEDSRTLGARLWDRTFPPKKQKLFRTEAASTLVWGDTVTGATMGFRSIYMPLFTPTPDIGMFSHDSWFAFTISLFAECAYIDRALIKYRIHAEQQIGIAGESEPPGRQQRARNLEHAIDQVSRLLEVVQSLAAHYGSLSGDMIDESMRRRALDRLDAVKNELLRFQRHSFNRRDLPRSIVKRVPTIASELKFGNYSKYANGPRSALADLLS